MQSEYLDKKVREAAEKHHPAYDEQAWQKMEKLLDHHLPVQKDGDRRRIFFLLFFFLLIGGGAFVLISKPWNKNRETAVRSTGNERVPSENKPAPDNNSASAVQPINSNAPTQNRSVSEDRGSQVNSQTEKTTPQQNNRRQLESATKTTGVNQAGKKLVSRERSDKTGVSIARSDINRPDGPTRETRVAENAIDNKKVENNQDLTVTGETRLSPNQGANKSEVVKAKPAEAQPGKPPIHKEKSSRRSGFAFLLSAGPDVSKVGNSDPGKLTLAYGAGISYTKNRFTLRTGIYGAKKIYEAGPGQYKLAYQPPNIKFEGADANCYVMEIPVQLFYNFASKNKSNWFAGAGLSSYLMKSEKYNYLFKTSTGVYYYKQNEYKNENKHYFSVLDLSGGYNLHISNTISVSAEPYLKIPLTGIGEGKVNLKSGGVLFTVGIKPFK